MTSKFYLKVLILFLLFFVPLFVLHLIFAVWLMPCVRLSADEIQSRPTVCSFQKMGKDCAFLSGRLFHVSGLFSTWIPFDSQTILIKVSDAELDFQ